MHQKYSESESEHSCFLSISRRHLLGLTGVSLAGAGFGVFSPPAMANNYPSRPVRFVVPYAAGGGTDLVIRALQENLGKALGASMVVDNKSGAAGAIGAREVARASADGYTLLVSNNGPSVILPLLQKDANYDPIKDFTPITMLASAPIVLIANPSVPATNPVEFIQWARQQNEGVTYASAGVGSVAHLAAEHLAKMAKIKLVHAPYRGQAPTLNAVIAGETQAAFTSSSDTLLAHIKSGRIRLIGIGSEQPIGLVPGGIPIATALPGYKADFWQGILGPAGLSPAIVQRIATEVQNILAQPSMKQRYLSMGYDVRTTSPDEFSKIVNSEVVLWKSLIAERGLRAE